MKIKNKKIKQKMKNKLREREREREIEREITFLCEKTMHRMKRKMSNL